MSGAVSKSACLLVNVLALALAGCASFRNHDPGSIYTRANRAYERGELRSALALADEGFFRAHADTSSEWYWKFRLLKAEMLLTQGKTAQASALLPASIPEPPATPELQARLLLDRGWLLFRASNYADSKQLLDRSLQIARAQGLSTMVAQIELRRAGLLIRGFSDTTAAESDSRDALQRARQTGDIYLEASALGNLGFIMMSAARYDEAISWFSQAVTVSDRLQSKSLSSLNLNNLGQCYVELGQRERAVPLFQRAGRLAAETGQLTGQQFSLGRMGDSYRNSAEYQPALSYYEQALGIAREIKDQHWIATWLDNLTATSLEMGDVDRAEGYSRQWLAAQDQSHDRLENLWLQVDVSHIAEAKRQFDRAEQGYRAVIRAADALGTSTDPSVLLESRDRLANVLAGEHRSSGAEVEFQKALLLINTARGRMQQDTSRITYFARLLRFYQDYVDFLVARHRPLEALSLAESSRARVLVEKLGPIRGSGGNPAMRDYRKLSRAAKTILLSYWLAPARSFLWVVTPDRIAEFELPSQARIEHLVTTYQDSIEALSDPLTQRSDIGRELSDTVLGPAQRFIPKGSKVAIVPDGVLHDLNFETLPAPSGGNRYWIEDVTVSVIPSLDLAFRSLGAGYNRKGPLLLIGDPLAADEKSKLLNAGAEIAKIKSHFQGAVVWTGEEARPEVYREAAPARFSIVHFAAHAEANSNDPLDSAILLSPGANSYKLYARDVALVPIHASLVTVSACRSAGARAYGGEGLVGFAWAFLEAGAKSVVAGLWEVDDLSTSELMDHMYAGLTAGQTPVEALRSAKLAMSHAQGPYRKPYYWAPFELITGSLER